MVDEKQYREPGDRRHCRCEEKWEIFEERLQDILYHLRKIDKRTKQMAVDQGTFDAELASLVSSITDLDNAVDAWIAANPSVDFSAEEAAVQQASAAVAAELAKVTPPVTPPPPSPAPAPGA